MMGIGEVLIVSRRNGLPAASSSVCHVNVAAAVAGWSSSQPRICVTLAIWPGEHWLHLKTAVREKL
jgi:hypothetical protein